MKSMLVMVSGFGLGVGALTMLERQRAAEADLFLADEQTTLRAAANDLTQWVQDSAASAGRRLQREFQPPDGDLSWTPGSRLLAAGFGGALLLTGLVRRGFFGLPLLLGGAGLLARGITNQPVGQLFRQDLQPMMRELQAMARPADETTNPRSNRPGQSAKPVDRTEEASRPFAGVE